MFRNKLGFYSLLILASLVQSSALLADDASPYRPSVNMMGELGLNTVPSARMSPEGTTRFTISRTAPYTQASLGLQITNRLYIGLRQTSESKNFSSETLHLYPGLDAKYMLYPERRFVPQIAVGVQSAFGHKRMAAEYLTLSKRYEDLDFTFGFGWGRMATQGGLPNPLILNRLLGSSNRDIDGENPNTPADWFKGDMGLFGGIEYTTPVNGLSFKADLNSDGWKAEKQNDRSFQKPSPWSVGLSYSPVSWIDAGIAYAKNETIMARISLTGQLGHWPFQDSKRETNIPLTPNRPDISYSDESDFISSESQLGLDRIFINDHSAKADLNIPDNVSTPHQIGESARYLSNISGKNPEQIRLHLKQYGLSGMDIVLNRSDLEQAIVMHRGSVEEIWRNVQFRNNEDKIPFLEKLSRMNMAKSQNSFHVDLVNDVSLSEEDSGLLHRTGITASYRQFFGQHFLSYQSLRLNISDNLEKLNEYRGISFLPVRGDIDKFTQKRLILDLSYYMGLATLAPDLHVASGFGYLEEMYMGLTGEVLYRPFHKNWAIGLETSLAFKREPKTIWALGLNGDHILTGFVNGYYEIPNTGTTLKVSAGRFLAGDFGGTVDLSNTFENGVKIGADISASNFSDRDVYGGKTNVYTGIHVSLPLGSLPYIPDGTRIITNAAPLGRDTSQRLDNPTQLYNRTENLSYRHITRQWSQMMPVQNLSP